MEKNIISIDDADLGVTIQRLVRYSLTRAEIPRKHWDEYDGDIVVAILDRLQIEQKLPVNAIINIGRATIRNISRRSYRVSQRQVPYIDPDSLEKQTTADIDNQIDAKNRWAILREYLSEQDAQLIYLHDGHDMTYREMGRALSIAPSTAHKRYHAAREQLRDHLSGSGPETHT